MNYVDDMGVLSLLINKVPYSKHVFQPRKKKSAGILAKNKPFNRGIRGNQLN